MGKRGLGWGRAKQQGAYCFDAFDIEASGGNIRGHQHVDLLVLELPAKKGAPEKAGPVPTQPSPATCSPPLPLPESFQPLGLGKVAVQLPNTESHQAKEDMQAVGLLLGLGEEHHVVWECPSEQSWRAEGDSSLPAPSLEPATRGLHHHQPHLPQWLPCPPHGWAGCG